MTSGSPVLRRGRQIEDRRRRRHRRVGVDLEPPDASSQQTQRSGALLIAGEARSGITRVLGEQMRLVQGDGVVGASPRRQKQVDPAAQIALRTWVSCQQERTLPAA